MYWYVKNMKCPTNKIKEARRQVPKPLFYLENKFKVKTECQGRNQFDRLNGNLSYRMENLIESDQLTLFSSRSF